MHHQQQQPGMQKWYDQQHPPTTEELRSVTPAMNNTRGSFRNSPAASANPGGSYAGGTPTGAGYDNPNRAGTPSRYLGAYNSPEVVSGGGSVGPSGNGGPGDPSPHQPPSSTGLIRLSLRKPMGIVFEPMYDPNNPSLQRGVRICDLPRTGAAALSRKLEVGDELLSINDKTMSRLSFDEIMDFIIEADPEEVNLLFRRPRKETLQARQGIKKPSSSSQPAVKWVDDDVRNKKKDKKKDRKSDKKSRRSKKEEDDTVASQEEEYRGSSGRGGSSSRKKGRGSRKHPYESESFLDLLIDTICANPDHACRERRRGGDDEYYSDEDEDGTFASQDDSTYVTYESEDHGKRRGKSSKKRGEESSVDEETEEDTVEEKWKRRHKEKKESRANKSPTKDLQRPKSPEKAGKTEEKYEDDGTLETVDSQDRAKGLVAEQPPLGLQPDPEPVPVEIMPPPPMVVASNVPPAPIQELEYDDRIDHGADVSVMESLGGPSLLIEKQRIAIAAKAAPAGATSGPQVPLEFIEKFGKDYPVTFGLTHEQTIQADPLKFYTSVVKGLLAEHEPEKVRLLDKLLAKYKGREDHLVQKLSVRYSKNEAEQAAIPEEHDEGEPEPIEHGYEEPQSPSSPSEPSSPQMEQHQSPAPEMMQPSEAQFTPDEWPDKEHKEAEAGDSQDDAASQSGESEYSGDSIDGTSPAVIAQVSELLNYVYGKTSVPGQIDRVSTIMRAYEGREAVLLELLETKALIKANKEKENAENLPSFLRNSQAMQFKNSEDASNGDMPPVTPMATQQHVGSGGTLINDDISSMSGVSSPAEGQQQLHGQILNPPLSVSVVSVSISPFYYFITIFL